VLRNLIDNALRYTPRGGSIQVDAVRDGDHVRISVCDTGPGLSHSELDRVFDQFYRGEQARSRTAPEGSNSAGAGLGLAIARALVEAHGGRIWAESLEGGGAAFHFTLPLADDELASGTKETEGT
jgi:signal transduction histidine kinase